MTADYPVLHQIPQLRKLWKEAFGDSDVFLDAFFAYGFSPRRCRCITKGDTVVSVLYWFEVTYRHQRFAYLYAVATAADYRGQGLFSALLADTVQVLTAEGFDGIQNAAKNALKEAIREHYREIIKNKPKEISGKVIIRKTPKVGINSGQYIIELDFLLESDRIVMYTMY